MPPPCEIDRASVVLIGSFNPSIFQPTWFEIEKLLGREEARGATVHVISPDVAEFATDRIEIQVLATRFQATARTAASHEEVRDLVIGIFELLVHTPVARMGINRSMHFAFGSHADLNRVGHALAPPTEWKGLIQDPVMRRLRMEARDRNADGLKVAVTVEPSPRLQHGVVVDVNNDYFRDQEERPSPQGIHDFVRRLRDDWRERQAEAMRIATSIVGMAKS